MNTQINTDTGRLSRRVCSIDEAATLAVSSEAKRMQAEGIHVVSFATGEPDFPTPDIIKEAAIAAINENFTHYTQVEGIPELRRVVAEKFTRDNNIPTDPSEVLISCGGKHSLFNALTAILNEGDDVVIPAPYWVSYPDMVLLTGGRPVIMRTSPENSYKLTPEQLRTAITPRTRAMIINSPSNPTGQMYTPQEMEALGEVIAEAGIYVLSDELYETLTYGSIPHFSIGSIPALRDLAVTINGVSKAYAMTGWRIGYMRGPEDLIRAAAKIQGQSTSNPASISQRAALAALTTAQDDARRMREAFHRRRDLTISLLGDLDDVRYPVPDGAFYIFLEVDSYFGDRINNSAAMASYLLREHHVATVPGGAFGNDKAIRLSYACSEENIREGTERIKKGLRALRSDNVGLCD